MLHLSTYSETGIQVNSLFRDTPDSHNSLSWVELLCSFPTGHWNEKAIPVMEYYHFAGKFMGDQRLFFAKQQRNYM